MRSINKFGKIIKKSDISGGIMDELIRAARKDMEEYASYAEKIAEKNLIKIF